VQLCRAGWCRTRLGACRHPCGCGCPGRQVRRLHTGAPRRQKYAKLSYAGSRTNLATPLDWTPQSGAQDLPGGPKVLSCRSYNRR